MSTSILSFNQWQILFHENMAALLRAQEALDRESGFWAVLIGLWKCSRHLKTLNASIKAISELPDGILSDDAIQSQIPQLKKLLTSLEELIDAAKRKGSMERPLTSAPLGSIRIRGEYIADYLESLEMSIDPEVLKTINEGRAQIERGEFEATEQLF